MLIESLMNRTLPSDIRQLTPPEWLLWAFEKIESSPPQPPHWSRHEFQAYCLELGGTIVWNSVIVVAPQPQRTPGTYEMLLEVGWPAGRPACRPAGR